MSRSNNLEASRYQNYDNFKINSRLERLVDSPISGIDLLNKK